MPVMFRQGDLLLIAVTAQPRLGTPIPRHEDRIILARGEASGHAHAVADAGAALYPNGRDSLLLVSNPAGATLSHEEHAPLHLPRGAYRVVIQRRYLPGGGSSYEAD